MIASIIIASYNRSELLMYGLMSLLKQKTDNIEIIVLNDGDPNDGTEGICELFSNDLNIKYFSTKRDFNHWRIPGFAINFGVKQSSSDIIFISCAEIYHFDNTLEKMINIINNNPKALVITHGKDDNGSFLHKLKNHEEITYSDYNSLPNLDNVRFPFFMGMKKEEFVKIGGYDEDFIGIGFDDNDIVHRLNSSGCHHCTADSRIIHLYHPRIASIQSMEIKNRMAYNNHLFITRNKLLIRNKNKNWGSSL